MLGTLPTEKKQHWENHIAAVVYAYNSIVSEATRYSPYRLMFGREAHLLIDLAFGMSVANTSLTSHRGYVEQLKRI